MNKIEFRHNEKDWGEKQHEISKQIVKCLKSGKEWGVKFYEIKQKKTTQQIRGIYTLLKLIKPHFDKWQKGDYSIEQIKEYVKTELDFTREPNEFEIKLMIKSTGFNPKTKEEKEKCIAFCKRMKQNKSFEFASKSELIEFIEKLQVWAQSEDVEKKKTGWDNVFIKDNND